MLKNEAKFNSIPNLAKYNGDNDDAYEDEDVQRYEADSYKLKYGDKWKRLASSVRDVLQPDGTIIREYVIEDPSMLDTLSDNNDEMDSSQCHTGNYQTTNLYYNRMDESMAQQQSTRTEKSQLYTEHEETYSADSLNYQKFIDTKRLVSVKPIDKCSMGNSYNLDLDGGRHGNGRNTYGVNRAYKSQFNLTETQQQERQVYPRQKDLLASFAGSFQKGKSKSSQNLSDVSMSRFFKPIAEEARKSDCSKQSYTDSKCSNSAGSSNSSSSSSSSSSSHSTDDEENRFDKEVESIHEQGEHLKQCGGSHAPDLPNTEDPTVEYEIVDEHGNQIMINDADKLKKLATSVSESLQPDGSIIKEYILNDPQIIEHIRNTIKSNSMANLLSNKSIDEDNNHGQDLVNTEKPKVEQDVFQEEVKRSQISLNKYGSRQIEKSPVTVETPSLSRIKKQQDREAIQVPTSPSKQQQEQMQNIYNDTESDSASSKSSQKSQSPTFLSQVKQTLSKFREKASPVLVKSPKKTLANKQMEPMAANHNSSLISEYEEPKNTTSEQFQRFISSASFNDFLQSEKRYFQRENAAIQDITTLSRNLLENPTLSDELEARTASIKEGKGSLKKNQQHKQQQAEQHYLQPVIQPKAQKPVQPQRQNQNNYQHLNQVLNQVQSNSQKPTQNNYQNQYMNNYHNQNQYQNQERSQASNHSHDHSYNQSNHPSQYYDYQNLIHNQQPQQPWTMKDPSPTAQHQTKRPDYENICPEKSCNVPNANQVPNSMETLEKEASGLKGTLTLLKSRKYEHKYENSSNFRKNIPTQETTKYRKIPNGVSHQDHGSNNNYENVQSRTTSGQEAAQLMKCETTNKSSTNQYENSAQPRANSCQEKQQDCIGTLTDPRPKVNHNEFEVRTRKGKALKFTITSEDTTESDIEECKAILNQSCENLLAVESPHSASSDNNNQKRTSPLFAHVKGNFEGGSSSKPIPPKKPNNFDMPKYTASPVIIGPVCNTNRDSFSKLSNLSSDSSSSIASHKFCSNEPINNKYNRYAKNSGSMSNLACPSNAKLDGTIKMRASNENINCTHQLTSFGKPQLMARNASNGSNKIVLSSGETTKGKALASESNRQIIIEPSLPKRNKKNPTRNNEIQNNTLCSFENYLKMTNQLTEFAKQQQQQQQEQQQYRNNFNNGNTYTKSTNDFPIDNKEKGQPTMNIRNLFNNNCQASVNNNNNNKPHQLESNATMLNGLNITPEMTQKLLLQLLLQQISSNLTMNGGNAIYNQHDNSYSYCHYNQFLDSQTAPRSDSHLTSVTEDAFQSDCDDTFSMNPAVKTSQNTFKRNNSKKFNKMNFEVARSRKNSPNNNNNTSSKEYELMQNCGLDSDQGCEKF